MPNQDLPLPNVYYVTVQSALDGATHHMYVAADFTGAALRKVQNLCVERYGFRPYKGNSSIKMRRFKLQDYLECPSGLVQALATAHQLGERDTLDALQRRPREVREAMQAPRETPAPIDHDAVMVALAAALAEVA